MLNLIGVIIAFAVIIFLIRKKFNFGLSLIIGSLIVGLFSLNTISLNNIIRAFVEGSIYSYKEPAQNIILYSNNQYTTGIYTGTIELALLMTLIFVLAKTMQETGAITKLINSLRTIFTKGGTLGAMPAVYGLMPVPGGALFSAPLIDEEGEKFGLDKNQKNFLNVWFRHIWFPIYPISSAMILICSAKFSNIDIYWIILANIPAFITTIIIGNYFLKKSIKKPSKKLKIPAKDFSGFIFLVPPLLPLVVYGILQFFGVNQIRGFLIGVILSIILVYYLIDCDKKQYFSILRNSLSFKLALAIFGIMIFREVFEASQATDLIADLLSTLPFASLWLIIVIPIFLGMLTGYNLGAVALSYPILLPFFPENLSLYGLVGISSLIFVSSLAGYLISPIHLCNVLSSDYLKTDTTKMYRMYVPAVLIVLIVQVLFIGIVMALVGFN